jgi:hypothetical protein
MLRILLLLLPLAALTACTDTSQDVDVQEKLKKDSTVTAQQIIFAAPQIIDSSHIIIYPLIFQRESYGDSYGSSGGGQITSYWNLGFYNTETQAQTMLTPDRKILIYSISHASSSSSTSGNMWENGVNIYKSNIVYTAVSKDFDANKKLDDDDPTYLFISNTDGTHFRQISPDNYNILSWEVVSRTAKIIMQGQKDDNGDKRFDDADATVPLIADVSLQKPVTETFRQNFVDSLKRRLVQIWKQ